MSIADVSKVNIINEYKQSEKDTGSPEVQVSLITKRIQHLTNHFKVNKKRFSLKTRLTTFSKSSS